MIKILDRKSSKSLQKEDDFWNRLTSKEVARLRKIEKEKTFTLCELKKELGLK
ncbi:hypothetical protein K9L63_02380 [Candidatus Gracilibacteria bacterium]|nr:hypothetical protein [Candidatus Gracilibacteria bacterium]